MDKITEILHYWFGESAENALPSKERTALWFAGDPATDAEIKQKFYADYTKATKDAYADWEKDPRGTLALIILLDQFSRHIYRNTAQAFEQDRKALNYCLKGIEQQYDHKLSLIERTFFYLPLMHSEDIEIQMLSLRAYKMLLGLSFAEARPIFQNCLNYAVQHEEIIAKFGRFPHRNAVLERVSTPEELAFLQTWKSF